MVRQVKAITPRRRKGGSGDHRFAANFGDRARGVFKRLSNEDIENYLASGEWRGKAGAYAIQGIAGSFVASYGGSALGLYAPGQAASFIASVIGAVLILIVWGFVRKS